MLMLVKKNDIENQKHLQRTNLKDSEDADSPSRMSPSPIRAEQIEMRDTPIQKAVDRLSSLLDEVTGKSPEKGKEPAANKLIIKLSNME